MLYKIILINNLYQAMINFPILQSLETNQITELLAKYSAQHELHSEALQRPHPSQTDPSPEQPSWVQA